MKAEAFAEVDDVFISMVAWRETDKLKGRSYI